MLKISKLLTLVVAISCTYASDTQNNKPKIFQITRVTENLTDNNTQNNKQKIFQITKVYKNLTDNNTNNNKQKIFKIIKVYKNLTDNNTQNIINDNIINENQDDVKENKKTPEYIKNFQLTQHELDSIKDYLLNVVPQSEIDMLKNKEINNKQMNIIEFVNTLVKREKNSKKKYSYNQFLNRPYVDGKWFKISNLDELNNNCINIIKDIIKHSFTKNRELLNNTEELKKIDGKEIIKEINNIISNVQTIIKNNTKLTTEIKESDLEKIITKKIFPNELKKDEISNIISCLSKNISDNELFNEYIPVLRNVLVQYGLCYSHFEGMKYIKSDKIVLANKHFSPFLDTNARRGIAYNTLYNIVDKSEDKVKLNIRSNTLTLDKRISLIPAENSKLYYIFNQTNKCRYINLDQNDNPKKLKQLQNKKTLLYINYLLHYFSFKIKSNINISNFYKDIFNNKNYYLSSDNINYQDKKMLNVVLNKMEAIIKDNDGIINDEKQYDLYRSIYHSRSNNILNENGEIVKISGHGNQKQALGEVDIFDNEKTQQNNNININNNNVFSSHNSKLNLIKQNKKNKQNINILIDNSNNSESNLIEQKSENEQYTNNNDVIILINNSNSNELDANEQNNNKLTNKKRNRERNNSLNEEENNENTKINKKRILKIESQDNVQLNIEKNRNKISQNIKKKQNTNNILSNKIEYNTKLNNSKNNIKLIKPIFADEQNNVPENRESNIKSTNDGELQNSNNNNNGQLIHVLIPYNTQLNNNILLSNNGNNLYHHYAISNQQFANLLNNDQNNNNNTLRVPPFFLNQQLFNLANNSNNQINKK